MRQLKEKDFEINRLRNEMEELAQSHEGRVAAFDQNKKFMDESLQEL